MKKPCKLKAIRGIAAMQCIAIIAFVAIIGFSIAACRDGNTDDTFQTPLFPARYQVFPAWTAEGPNTIRVTSPAVASPSVSRAAGDIAESGPAKYLPIHYSERVVDEYGNHWSNYVIYLGRVDYVPIEDSLASYNYSGVSTSNIYHTQATITTKTISSSVEKTVSETTTISNTDHNIVDVKVGFTYKGFSASARVMVESTQTNETVYQTSTTHKDTVLDSVTNATKDTISYTIGNNGEPAGRYRISLFCTTDVYLVVKLNDNKEKLGDPAIVVCPREGSYTYSLDYDPSPTGDFKRTEGGEMLSIPTLDDLSSFPDAPDRISFQLMALGKDGRMAETKDGINWNPINIEYTPPSNPFQASPPPTWNDVAAGGGKFVAVASNRTIAYSQEVKAEGVELFTWVPKDDVGNAANTTSNPTQGIANWDCVTYASGKFIAFSNSTNRTATTVGDRYGSTTTYSYNSVLRIGTSSDGIIWDTPATTIASMSGSDLKLVKDVVWGSVIWGDVSDPQTGRWVAVGAGGIRYNNTPSPSTSGWTVATGSTGDWNGVTFGDGKYIAVGPSGMAYSTNGTNWSPIPISGSTWNNIVFANDMFVAVGTDGGMAYSTDGIHWTIKKVGFNGVNWNDVTYINETLWVVVGGIPGINSGEIAYSTDGINWTDQPMGETGKDYWQAITYRFIPTELYIEARDD
jgi:hypothetical protein